MSVAPLGENRAAPGFSHPRLPPAHTLLSWCLRELVYWRASRLNGATLAANLDGVNRERRTAFLLEIAGRRVHIRDKPDFYTRSELDDAASANSTIVRIHKYRDFIELSLSVERHDLRALIAVDVNDKPLHSVDTPIFGFQKERGAPAILLPDIDFLRGKLYRSLRFNDRFSYADKTPTAIFVGATTGVNIITSELVRKLAVPRIRSAIYFKDNPDVSFTLPKIGGCDSVETEQLIRSLGVSGPHLSLEEQYRHRFLISMDGHGATCRRVALALRSHSVLLKYDSPHVLYYFDKMIPWLHFIPISQDRDVETIVQIEQNSPGTFAFITKEANIFYEKHLTPAMVMRYTVELLSMYADVIPQESRQARESSLGWPLADASAAQNIDCLLHFQIEGDRWFRSEPWNGRRGSGRHIEGFAIYPHDRYVAENLTCQVRYADDTESEPCGSGVYCGTKGRMKPLTGINFKIGGADAGSYLCSYTGISKNGDVIGPVDGGQWCDVGDAGGFEAFQLTVARIAS